ncbi:MAG: cytidine deaminase [Verrucomicrobiales bacterium]|nr:cytidine deaminase [Verrucomicrobiales bacterium]
MSDSAERGVLSDLGGHVAAAEVAEMAAALDLTRADLGQLMRHLLPLAQAGAVVPLSGFAVGAVAAGMAADGAWPDLFFGANLEFEHAGPGFSLHAEQAAVNQAWLRGAMGVSALAVSAAPCGFCRQFLRELAGWEALEIWLPGGAEATSLAELLPDSFGPEALSVRGGLMERAAPSEEGADAADVARAAARLSYTPYLAGGAGVALQLADDQLISGRLLQNAAHNPGLSPLASALSFLHITRPDAPRITRCVLARTRGGVDWALSTRWLLAQVAPGVELEILEMEA